MYIDFVKEEFKRLLANSKVRAEAAPHNDYAFHKIRYRNWLSVLNLDSGVWLTAGISQKVGTTALLLAAHSAGQRRPWR